MTHATRDRFGLGFRPQLAAAMLANLDAIDVIEVIAETLFEAPRAQRDAMRMLSRQVPVMLHGVSLGLASAFEVAPVQLERFGRAIDWLRPELISEHLAFVRAGGVEIGHLAAPPRTEQTIEGTAENVRRARRVLGMAPVLENVATLIDPPGSRMGEPEWVSRALQAADAGALLDLHNLYANAYNFGDGLRTACAMLDALPLSQVRVVHLAGGRMLRNEHGASRLLDDHLHEAPDEIFTLLRELGARVPQALDVVIERDGAYPAFSALLAELARARQALAEGRALRTCLERVA